MKKENSGGAIVEEHQHLTQQLHIFQGNCNESRPNDHISHRV